MADSVRIGLIQLTAEDTPAANVRKTLPRIEEAAAKGAKIIGLQEMFTTKYFCIDQDPKNFDLAEPIETGPSVTELAKAATVSLKARGDGGTGGACDKLRHFACIGRWHGRDHCDHPRGIHRRRGNRGATGRPPTACCSARCAH